MRVVLVPFPLQGHITPMLQLGSMLHSKGFSITIAHTDHNPPNPSNHPNFTFVNLPDQLGRGADIYFQNPLSVIFGINSNCGEPLRNVLSEMIENQERDGILACVIYDPLVYFVDSVVKELQIPSLILRITGSVYLKALRVNIQLHEENPYVIPESMLLEKVSNLEPLRFKDLPSPLHVKVPEVVIQLQRNLIDKGSSLGFVWNSVDDIEGSILSELKQQYNVPFFSIGPFHKLVPPSLSTSLMEEDKSCIEWLDKQSPKSVLYVSFGSLATLESRDLVEVSRGLAQSEQHFLWVIRPGLIKGSKWIEDLPEGFIEEIGQKGLIVKWVPQREVLSHFAIGAFLSQCGWNSVMESLGEGLPMICKPCHADQKVIARYLTHVWKIGILLDDPLDRESIEKSIRKVMIDEEGKDMRENAMNLKQKIDASVNEGGSSYKSLNDLADSLRQMEMFRLSYTFSFFFFLPITS
ncbi:hypothetical protein M9H77_25526 [Catharanthus roseus]|uniref:Uncharacterized protein n=1 Tax=Catharanthus roseus TaxID=4058 RepID=A0ACC0A9Q7_CATRO|nr:hypothetical protein M9H77_25526 [Catharanthus roseus]